MYSNNILNFQVSTTILYACKMKVWKLIEQPSYVCVFVCVCMCECVLGTIYKRR